MENENKNMIASSAKSDDNHNAVLLHDCIADNMLAIVA